MIQSIITPSLNAHKCNLKNVLNFNVALSIIYLLDFFKTYTAQSK